MKNTHLLLLLLLIHFFSANKIFSQEYSYNDLYKTPQNNIEVGFTLGANNFLVDLGGNLGKGRDFLKDYNFKTVRPLLGFSLNYYALRWLNINTGINFTTVTGADSLVKNAGGLEKWRYNRNLSFKSSIFEGFISAEIYPLYAIRPDFILKRLTPYAGVGIGFFHFNPKAKYNGKWVELKPLRLEGEGFAEYPYSKPYNLMQVYVPVTFGLKYTINQNFNLLGGLLLRITSTDHIDDVSSKYIDPTLFNKYLSPAQAALAKNLYSRSKTPWKVKPGIDRADSDGNRSDSYITFFLTLRYTLSSAHNYYDCWHP